MYSYSSCETLLGNHQATLVFQAEKGTFYAEENERQSY